MIKRLFCALLMLNVLGIFCTGCWNYREINNMSIVAGAAIDKTSDGKYKLSIEIIDLKAAVGVEAQVHSKKLECYGASIVDAVRNAISFNANKLYWGHTEILIISKDVAKEGIVQILDVFSRDPEFRLSIDILVSKEDTAEEILDSQSITTEVRSYELNKMLDLEKELEKAPKVEIYEFINSLGESGISSVMPVVGLLNHSGQETSQLSGPAVFNKDKLRYMFDQEDTKYFLFVMNKIKGGLLVVNDSDITLKIIRNKTKLKPVYTNGKLHFEINIKTKTSMSEIDFTKFRNMKDIDKIQIEAQKILKSRVENVIKAVQNEYGIDIFGFGRSVRQDIPELWKKINPDWDTIFKSVPVNVNVDVKISNSGLLSKKIMIGD